MHMAGNSMSAEIALAMWWCAWSGVGFWPQMGHILAACSAKECADLTQFGMDARSPAAGGVLQTNSLENVYVTDSRGHIMLFQIRYDASVGVSASRVRTYAGSELLGVAIFGLEIVTAQLLEGKRISSVQLSMADDWALLFSRDHVIRLVSLQRGVLKVEQKMLGIHCGNYAVRGTISPDGQYVDGKQLVPPAVPQVRLAGPLMDVVWSERHHFVACCAMDEHALPLLAFVGEDAKDVQRPPKEGTKDPTTAHSPDLQSTLAISGISPSIDSDYRRWADHWINGNENARSAITMEEKKRMKENILLRILDKKAEEYLDCSESRSLPW
ncbi:Hypothetical protein (Fragment) [Durusdinium trenchii]|uniref:Uncharacterized protein n=1 Tax=Durusdinium trenchii TaxID=1381693 RepID=A0ABP0MVQ1_9DINO